jgi:4-amino-4-deoxy-L-arabinose transferase-like glycosyltransferase
MAIPLFLYLFAFAVRLVLVLTYPDPAYPDSYYYVDVAKALHNGQGLNVDFVWIFAEVGDRIPANPTLPIPSNAHWLPLASFIQAASLAVFGNNAVAHGIPLALISALAAPLTWLIARQAGARPSVQLGAALLAAVPAAGTVFMGQPENFAILHPLVAATIWLTARGLKGDPKSYVLAGVLVGLASIARNDGSGPGGTTSRRGSRSSPRSPASRCTCW